MGVYETQMFEWCGTKGEVIILLVRQTQRHKPNRLLELLVEDIVNTHTSESPSSVIH